MLSVEHFLKLSQLLVELLGLRPLVFFFSIEPGGIVWTELV